MLLMMLMMLFMFNIMFNFLKSFNPSQPLQSFNIPSIQMQCFLKRSLSLLNVLQLLWNNTKANKSINIFIVYFKTILIMFGCFFKLT